MDLIVTYLKNDELPENKTEARVLRLKAAYYVIYDGLFYATFEVCSVIRGRVHNERNPYGHMLESCWGVVLGIQDVEIRILLANNEGGLHGVRQEM